MVKKKDLFVAVLAVFCLIVMMFLVTPKPSKGQSQTATYNPWADINGDGTIDIYDAVLLSQSFGTSGTPLNQTELLDANNTIANLESELQVAISEMNPSDKGIEIDSVDWNRGDIAEAGVTDVVVRNLCLDNVTVTSLKLFWTSNGGYLASSAAEDTVISGGSTANFTDFLPINGWNTVYDTWTLEVYTSEGYNATSTPLMLVV